MLSKLRNRKFNPTGIGNEGDGFGGLACIPFDSGILFLNQLLSAMLETSCIGDIDKYEIVATPYHLCPSQALS